MFVAIPAYPGLTSDSANLHHCHVFLLNLWGFGVVSITKRASKNKFNKPCIPYREKSVFPNKKYFVWSRMLRPEINYVEITHSYNSNVTAPWSVRRIPLNTWRNNKVVITTKQCHFGVITSKWRHFDVITTSLLRNVSAGTIRLDAMLWRVIPIRHCPQLTSGLYL